MTSGSQATLAAVVFSEPRLPAHRSRTVVRDNGSMVESRKLDWPHARLRKHVEYQHVYQAGRKQFSPSMSYFFRLRAHDELTPFYDGPRIGLTAGRVLGKAVERNRIKRRMREAARLNLTLLPAFTDVVLHPRKLVLEMEFAKLEREVAKVFSAVAAQAAKTQAVKTRIEP